MAHPLRERACGVIPRMSSRFRHVALVGRYQAAGMRDVLDEIARFLVHQGLEVSLERQSAQATGLSAYPALTPEELGRACDLAIVVGGDDVVGALSPSLPEHPTNRAAAVTNAPSRRILELPIPLILPSTRRTRQELRRRLPGLRFPADP